MKTSTATLLGVGALTAAVVGFGAAIPSLADEATALVSSVDGSAATQDGTSQDGTTEDGQRPAHGPGHGRHGGGLSWSTAAETLGLTEEELRTELEAGSTLAQIAETQGVERQTLVDALLAAQEERLQTLLDEQLTGGPGGRGHHAPGESDDSTTDDSTTDESTTDESTTDESTTDESTTTSDA